MTKTTHEQFIQRVRDIRSRDRTLDRSRDRSRDRTLETDAPATPRGLRRTDVSVFCLTYLADCDSCDLEIADDDATTSGWTHVTERRGFDPERWEYETYGDDLHDATPREGTVRRWARS